MTHSEDVWITKRLGTHRNDFICSIVNAGKGGETALRIYGDANFTISNLTFKSTDYICLEIGDSAKFIN